MSINIYYTTYLLINYIKIIGHEFSFVSWNFNTTVLVLKNLKTYSTSVRRYCSVKIVIVCQFYFSPFSLILLQ